MTKLKTKIDKHGIKQQRICDLTKIPKGVLSEIVNGLREPTGLQRVEILYVLNVLLDGGPYVESEIFDNGDADASK